jgi:uncharacterized membrane protein YgcG
MDERQFQREKRSAIYIDQPILYGWVYPNLLMVLMIMMAYSCIAPLLMPVCSLFYVLAYLMYKYQLLYVYINQHQSGGNLWYSVFNMSIVALVSGVFTLLSYLLIRGSNESELDAGTFNGPFYGLLPVPFFIFLFWYHCDRRFKRQSMSLALESALEIDKAVASLHHLKKATPLQHFNNKLYRQPSLVVGNSTSSSSSSSSNNGSGGGSGSSSGKSSNRESSNSSGFKNSAKKSRLESRLDPFGVGEATTNNTNTNNQNSNTITTAINNNSNLSVKSVIINSLIENANADDNPEGVVGNGFDQFGLGLELQGSSVPRKSVGFESQNRSSDVIRDRDGSNGDVEEGMKIKGLV